MKISRTLLLTSLVTSTIGLTGCPGDGTHPTTATRPNASVTASPDKSHDLVSRHPRPALKTPRESFLSTYSNPEEGISFRYPRYYALEEGDVEEHSYFLTRQEELDVEQPGARLVATLLIPEDGYPNTTFEHGSLQLLAQDAGTPENCRELSKNEDATALPRSLTLHDEIFRGTELKYETGGIQVFVRDYVGFSGGTCYEFHLVVAVRAQVDPNGTDKPADEPRIMRQLEKIVGSVQFLEQREAPGEELNAENARRL